MQTKKRTIIILDENDEIQVQAGDATLVVSHHFNGLELEITSANLVTIHDGTDEEHEQIDDGCTIFIS